MMTEREAWFYITNLWKDASQREAVSVAARKFDATNSQTMSMSESQVPTLFYHVTIGGQFYYGLCPVIKRLALTEEISYVTRDEMLAKIPPRIEPLNPWRWPPYTEAGKTARIHFTLKCAGECDV